LQRLQFPAQNPNDDSLHGARVVAWPAPAPLPAQPQNPNDLSGRGVSDGGVANFVGAQPQQHLDEVVPIGEREGVANFVGAQPQQPQNPNDLSGRGMPEEMKQQFVRYMVTRPVTPKPESIADRLRVLEERSERVDAALHGFANTILQNHAYTLQLARRLAELEKRVGVNPTPENRDPNPSPR
jgi:hypothetical protein